MTALFIGFAVVLYLGCVALCFAGAYMRYGKSRYDPIREQGNVLLAIGVLAAIFATSFVLLVLFGQPS